MESLTTLFGEIDTRELTPELETRWYQRGRQGFDFLYSQLSGAGGEGASEWQLVHGLYMLSRMRFQRDPELVRKLLSAFARDDRLRVRSRAAQYLVGTMRSEALTGKRVADAHPEYLAALQEALALGVHKRSERFVRSGLRALDQPT